MNSDYKGKILISTPDISGDIFSRSVVLIIDHDVHGAFGLILNRKNEELSRRVGQLFGFRAEIYDGGPVENNRTFIIAKGIPVSEYYVSINNEFYLTEDTESVTAAVLEGRLNIADIKVFSGYSGWSSRQLESEVFRKMWTVADIYNLDYTMPNDQSLWKKIMLNLGGKYLLWANAPEDVGMN
ncbi:MAG: YqgE/AlgH family protein [Bergeyella sp.]